MHIFRILGRFQKRSNINPNDVYAWFMQFFIDAYDWVMVPNVYGMSQYANENCMTTKPYISGSNYILKISNFKKDDWAKTWDALYWSFILQKQKLLSTNVRMKTTYMLLKRMKKSTIEQHLEIAQPFLKRHPTQNNASTLQDMNPRIT